MTVYKINKKLVYLLILLCVTSVFFSFTVLKYDYSGGAAAVCFVIELFLLYNLALLFTKKIFVEDGQIRQFTLYGKKEIKIDEIEEVGVVNLRWRIILILSDPHKFVFISSLYDDFDGFIDFLRPQVCEDAFKSLEKVTHKKIKHKNDFLMGMLLAGSLFFVGAGVYNIIYR